MTCMVTKCIVGREDEGRGWEKGTGGEGRVGWEEENQNRGRTRNKGGMERNGSWGGISERSARGPASREGGRESSIGARENSVGGQRGECRSQREVTRGRESSV